MSGRVMRDHRGEAASRAGGDHPPVAGSEAGVTMSDASTRGRTTAEESAAEGGAGDEAGGQRWAVAVLIVASVLFGCSGVFAKLLFVEQISPVQVTALRTLVATVCIVAFAVLLDRRTFAVTAPQLRFLAGFSVIFTLVQLSFYWTVALTDVAIAISLQYTAPVFVLIYDSLRGRRVGAAAWAAVAVAVVGCALLTRATDAAVLAEDALGIAVGLLSGVIFAAYNIAGNGVAGRRIGTITASIYSFGLSGAGWAVLMLAGLVPVGELTGDQIGNILFIGIGATFVPFVLLTYALRRVRADRATVIGMVDPLSAAVLAYLLLGEALDALQAVGMAMVLAAIVLLGRARRAA
ncbi:hypothetical protein CH340_11470 [Rhodoplanes serenus]|nr:hypothetical protein CH340_11470 [Rhodoplanes serenus]